MELSLELLGVSKEQLLEMVVERIVEQALRTKTFDENENEGEIPSELDRQIKELVRKRIDERVTAIAQERVLPNVSQYIENAVLQQTNKWGEKVGKPQTFTEYLVSRAETYLTVEVDSNGKARHETDSSYWNGSKQTRIVHLVHEHLTYEIGTTIKEVMKAGTGAIAKGIWEACRLRLNEAAAALQVSVKIP